MKQRMIPSLTGSIQGKRSDIEGRVIDFSSEEETLRCSTMERRPVVNSSNDFRVEIPEFEGNLIQTSSLNGYKQMNASLSTKSCQMIRNLNLLLLDCENMSRCG